MEFLFELVTSLIGAFIEIILDCFFFGTVSPSRSKNVKLTQYEQNLALLQKEEWFHYLYANQAFKDAIIHDKKVIRFIEKQDLAYTLQYVEFTELFKKDFYSLLQKRTRQLI